MATTLNERAKSARIRAGFTTPGAAADAIGCTRTTVIRWEDDPAAVSIGGKYLNKAAAVYRVRPEWLLLESNDDGYPWVAEPLPSPPSQSVRDDEATMTKAGDLVASQFEQWGVEFRAREDVDLILGVYRVLVRGSTVIDATKWLIQEVENRGLLNVRRS